MFATLTFDDPGWDTDAIEQKLAAEIKRSRKELKEAIREKHREGGDLPAASIVSRRSGAGFRRGHKVSRPGSPPSPDTLTLMNAIDDREVGPLEAEVYIKPDINPHGGMADRYGEILDNPSKLNRPFFESTAAEFKEKFDQRIAEIFG